MGGKHTPVDLENPLNAIDIPPTLGVNVKCFLPKE